MNDRFEVSTYEETRYFRTYAKAFKYYMSIRDDVPWLYVYDNEKGEYLIVEGIKGGAK